jgi:zinc transport system ATP-binding protein
MERPPVVEMRNLTFGYDHNPVIDGLNLTIHRRDFVGLIGSNGAGKTTLLKMLVGLLKPSTGDIELFGRSFRQFNEWQRIGYVPQKNALNPLFPATVREVVLSGLYNKSRMFRRLKPHDRKRCEDALASLQISDLADRRIGQLSGGQQQRVFLARALIGNPDLLILDEPMVGIDAETQKLFFSMLRHMHSHHHITFVMVSHDVDLIRSYLGEHPLVEHQRLKFYVKSMDNAAICRETDLTHTLKDWPGLNDKATIYH